MQRQKQHRLTRRRLLTLLGSAGATLPLVGLHRRASAQSSVEHRWTGIALGAPAELRLIGMDKSQSEALFLKLEREIQRLEAIFSLYRKDSALMRLNLQGRLLNPPLELLVLLSLVDRMHSLTDGYFDPTIQPLWALYAESRGQPSAAALEAVRNSIGWNHVRFNAGEVRLQASGAALSLNGIAQGFITDRIAEILLQESLAGALIKLGEIRVIGHDARGEPWRVGLANSEGMQAEHYLSLSDRAVATSASYGTTFAGASSHILNPHTGLAATALWQRVSVVHPSAAVCDAISTAAVLMDGPSLKRMSAEYADLVIHAVTTDGRLVSYPESGQYRVQE